MNEVKGFVGTYGEGEGGDPTQSPGSSTTPSAVGFNGHLLYVHDCGNHPKPSVLKGRWDDYLFGHEMGDRSRMAYWVNPQRYAFPLPESYEADTDAAAPRARGYFIPLMQWRSRSSIFARTAESGRRSF